MKRLRSFLQKIKLRQVVTIFLAGLMLFAGTACNNGDVRGARPENPPVQLGGANNPTKGGGDGYTEYKMSQDASAKSKVTNSGNQAALPLSNSLIAATTNLEDNSSKLLYPGSEDISTSARAKVLQEKANKVAEESQPVLRQTDPNAKLLEKTQKAFGEASSFLKDVGDAGNERPELQANPAKNQ